jgi:hypothetical protein
VWIHQTKDILTAEGSIHTEAQTKTRSFCQCDWDVKARPDAGERKGDCWMIVIDWYGKCQVAQIRVRLMLTLRVTHSGVELFPWSLRDH